MTARQHTSSTVSISSYSCAASPSSPRLPVKPCVFLPIVCPPEPFRPTTPAMHHHRTPAPPHRPKRSGLATRIKSVRVRPFSVIRVSAYTAPARSTAIELTYNGRCPFAKKTAP